MRRVHLTARDLAILEDLVDRRCETLDQLRREHFHDNQRDTARARLRRLTAAGYLNRTTLPLAQLGLDPQHVYTLGPRATAAVRLRSRASITVRERRFKPTMPTQALEHQLIVNRLGALLGVKLTPEHRLASDIAADRWHRPDATFRADQPDKRGRDLVFLEFDLGHYNRRRLRDKVDAFLESPRAHSLLLVVPDQARAERVTRWLTLNRGPEHLDPRVVIRTLEDCAGRGRPTGLSPPSRTGRPAR